MGQERAAAAAKRTHLLPEDGQLGELVGVDARVQGRPIQRVHNRAHARLAGVACARAHCQGMAVQMTCDATVNPTIQAHWHYS